jgi:23S rRNA pseudouridine2605 synthase
MFKKNSPKNKGSFNKGDKPERDSFKKDNKRYTDSDNRKSFKNDEKRADDSDKKRSYKRAESSSGDTDRKRPLKKSESSFNDADKRRSYNRADKSSGDNDRRRPSRSSESSFNEGDKRRSYNRADKPSGDNDRRRPSRSSENPFNEGDKRRSYNRADKPSGDNDRRRPSRSSESPFNEGDKRRSYNRADKPSGDTDRRRPFQKEGSKFEESDRRDSFTPKRTEESGKNDSFKKEGKRFQDSENKEYKPAKFKKSPISSQQAERPYNNSAKRRSSKQDDGKIRLNKYLSNAGIASRRKADELIIAGEVSVNGQIITELGYKVNPTDEIRFSGTLLRKEKPVYVLLNKPKDYITTTEDPLERKTVMHLVERLTRERVYPVGRLDRNTTGLILLTNDGELAQKLSHPKNGIKKLYSVSLDKNLKHEHFKEIAEQGVELEDGLQMVDEIAYIDGETKKDIGIEIHSGKNRVVRRIFEHYGYKVLKLDRVMYAGLTKKNLPRGESRFLTREEITILKSY